MDATINLASAVAAAVIAGVTALLTTLLTQKITRNQIYTEKQLACYQKLWGHLKPLSRVCGPDTIMQDDAIINRQNAIRFCNDYNCFFFSEEGLFLSRKTRNSLFDLRNFLLDLTRKAGSETEALTEKQTYKLNLLYKNVFTSIRNDVGLRDFAAFRKPPKKNFFHTEE